MARESWGRRWRKRVGIYAGDGWEDAKSLRLINVFSAIKK